MQNVQVVVNGLCYEIIHNKKYGANTENWHLVLCNYSAHEDDTYFLATFNSEEKALDALEKMSTLHKSLLDD